jgi:hypothetical protein
MSGDDGCEQPAALRGTVLSGAEPPLKRVEAVLAVAVVVLKLDVLYGTWGRIQGFDADPWMNVFRATHWFRPLPGVREMYNSYHPPLSYLLCRLIYAVYPHDVEASQIMSTLALIAAVFALRATLRTIGVLWTLSGLVLLYGFASVPLVVWLGIETSYDPLIMFWFAITLLISVQLLWQGPPPARWWKRPRYVAGTVGLGLALAGGMLTKFTTLVVFGVPFVVVLARRGPRAVLHELAVPAAAVSLAAILVSPFYYQRYWKPYRELFPQAMSWLEAPALKEAVAARDAHRWRFLLHVLRIPKQAIVGTQTPVTDSFIYSIWLHLWKRDVYLGEQGRLSLVVSDVYVCFFALLLPASTIAFACRRRRLPPAWRQLGLVFLIFTVVFCAAMFRFGWQFPLWQWRIFKAKYISPIALWAAYCMALPFVGLAEPSAPQRGWARSRSDLLILALLLFMFANHLLPVY